MTSDVTELNNDKAVQVRTSWMLVINKMRSNQTTEIDLLTRDLDIVELEGKLKQRRKIITSIIIMIYLITISVMIYSVIHDMRIRNGKFAQRV